MTGLFGIASSGNCISKLYYGTDYHSHLGTSYGGISYIDDMGQPIKRIHDISNSQFKSKFDDEIEGLSSGLAIGVISDKDPQPLTFVSKFGPFAVCVNGLINNKDDLKDRLIEEGTSFAEVYHGDINQADLVANLMNKGRTIEEGIRKMWEMIDGSISLLVLTPEGIIAARDHNGVSPLVLGKDDESWVAASESSSLPNLGLEFQRELSPGEIILMKSTGTTVLHHGSGRKRICAFLWIYTGFPASTYEGINVEEVRERSGRLLAENDDVEVDMAAGVPDSGTSHAIGYAMGAGVPFRRVLLKYTPGYGRSYTPLTQEVRDKVALMKLVPNHETIRGNRIVLCEDSIVRGTQLKNFTVMKLRQCGVSEVHVRPACPPLMFPCRYMLSTRSTSELATRKAIRELEGKDAQDVSRYIDDSTSEHEAMVEWIRKDLDLDTLRYQRLNDMIKAIGLPKDQLCLFCWNGEKF
ncbi:MAG: amidophosphoribosyltransferase [Thermoplasmatota archaeon]